MSENGAGAALSGGGLWWAAAGVLALSGAVAFWAWRDDGSLPEAAVEALSDATSAPVVSALTPEEPEPREPAAVGQTAAPITAPVEPVEEAAAAAPPILPSIDEVRVDQGGMMVIAGRAAPGARVDVLVDGEVVTSVEADGGGVFAALGTVSANASARSLTLRSGEGATAVASAEEIILAPVAAEPQTQEEEVAALAEPATVQPEPQAEATPGAGTQAAETGASSISDMAGASDGVEVVQSTPEVGSSDGVGGSNGQGVAVVADAEAGANLESAGDSNAAAVPDAEAMAKAQTETETAAAPTAERIAVLRSDAAGVSLMQTAPDPPDAVVLDTIGYSDAGEVQLSGRADAGATEVLAYIDNQPVARLTVDETGAWRGDVPQIDPGVYTLRIDAVTATGEVTSRIETPFLRETPEALAAAEEAADAGPVRAVTVQAGDTLWAIARDRYGEGILYVQVFEANRAAIRNPDLIYPGQVFDLPGD